MKLIIINGHSCSGKSTVIKRLVQQREWLYHLSYDAQKWSFSGYSPSKHKEHVEKLVISLADTVTSLGYPILWDSALFREQRENLISLARARGYEVFEINIEAEYSVLESRFLARVEKAKAENSTRISNTSIERFRELADLYEQNKNPKAELYRSDILTPEEIVSQVVLYTGL